MSNKFSSIYFSATVLLCWILILASYSNFFKNSFHFDDFHTIEQNLYIRNLDNIPDFFTDSSTFSNLPDHQSYRPVTTLFMALDYAWTHGLNPAVYHTTQLLLLYLNGFLLFFFYYFLMNQVDPRTSNRYWALFAATFFCLHVTNTETMNIISHRSELLSTAGVLGSFLMYLYWKGGRRYYLYLIPMILGALAKPPAIIFAPLLFFYVLFFIEQMSLSEALQWKNREKVWKALREALPALILGLTVFFFIGRMDNPHLNYSNFNRWDYLKTQPFVWLHYFRLFLLPVGLSADTDWNIFNHWYDTRIWVGLLGIFLLFILIFRISKNLRLRLSAFGLIWFALALLPTSSFFPLSEVTNDHRVFFPYMGLVLAVVWGLVQGFRWWSQKYPAQHNKIRALAVLLAVLSISGMAFGTYQRNKAWQTEETLWRDVTQKSPGNGRAWMNYGLTQMRKGKIEEARNLFERAHLLNPNYSTLEINLGIVYDKLGETERAEGYFLRALSLTPDYPAAHYYYANWLVKQKKPYPAIRHLERAITLSPGDPDSNALLLRLYAAAGKMNQFQELLAHLNKIQKNNELVTAYEKEYTPSAPGENPFQTLFYLGSNQLTKNQFLNAAQFFRQSIELNPNSAEAYNNLGWAQAQLGFTHEAVDSFEKALALNPDFPQARNNLNWLRNMGKPNKDSP